MLEIRRDKEGENLPQRYPFIAIVGPVGIGKTTFTDLVVKDTGITQFQEPYQENPYLKDFYTKDPVDYSFNSQMFFLANKGLQTGKIWELAKENPVVQDPGKEVDLMIATVQWKMGWMTDEQHEAYVSTFNKVFEGSLNPDVYIALKAKESTVIERIKKREREMELTMLAKYPEYFPMIAREFEGWLKQKRKDRDSWVTVIDSDKFDFAPDGVHKEEVVTEIKNWLSYFMTNPCQRNGVGSDGTKLIVPGSFKVIPHFIDRIPGAKLSY